MSLSGCDQFDLGLTPINDPSGFKGVIHFTNWPAADSVLELRLVIFKNYPSDSTNLIVTVLNALINGEGDIVIYPVIGTTGWQGRYSTDSLAYTITTSGTTLQVGQYNYVALAWRYGTNYMTDWKLAGVYSLTNDVNAPSPLRVLLHKTTGGIDINVDFHNLPPRPWQ